MMGETNERTKSSPSRTSTNRTNRTERTERTNRTNPRACAVRLAVRWRGRPLGGPSAPCDPAPRRGLTSPAPFASSSHLLRPLAPSPDAAPSFFDPASPRRRRAAAVQMLWEAGGARAAQGVMSKATKADLQARRANRRCCANRRCLVRATSLPPFPTPAFVFLPSSCFSPRPHARLLSSSCSHPPPPRLPACLLRVSPSTLLCAPACLSGGGRRRATVAQRAAGVRRRGEENKTRCAACSMVLRPHRRRARAKDDVRCVATASPQSSHFSLGVAPLAYETTTRDSQKCAGITRERIQEMAASAQVERKKRERKRERRKEGETATISRDPPLTPCRNRRR